MARPRRPQRDDELVVLKALSAVRGGRVCAIFTVYRPVDHRSVFRGTVARWDTEDGWARTVGGLGFLEPAKLLTLGDLGMGGELSKLVVSHRGRYMPIANAKGFLERLVKRGRPLSTLLERNSSLREQLRFETVFDGRGLDEIDDSEWHVAERPPRTERRKKRVVY